MKKNEWESVIRINILVLKSVGLWPKFSRESRINLYTLYRVICIYLFVDGPVFFQILYVFLVPSDLDSLTKLMFSLLTKAMVCVKVYFLMRNLKNVQQLVTVLNDDLFQLRNSDQWKMMGPALFVRRMTFVGFWSLAGTTSTLWSIFPLLDKSFKEFRLPFPAWYPYDTKKTPLYEISYIHQVIHLGVAASIDANLDTLISSFMLITGGQCDILCDNLRNTKPENFAQELLMSIQHHKLILSFAENSNRFFSMIVLGQFFTASVNIAMAMFRLSMVAPLSSEGYSLLFYVSAITIQLFAYCWFGNEVESKLLIK
ncbi:7tm 6 domain containing protein [Asbolus verrucosus]|uniref:7tm 6 domain containing protein n=1 Tax=Asbolus verrucosus TaxID=1661398 RepID=A0A482WDW0_ASBVE|nr:7tm 6 domain containing protein [Asbolus verrucosus]